ncbi:hypothetical protein [Pseudoxanthomonas indica]|uniref:Uncharacterized protein n=1 Tax=Pseudoxanthomonas indica TaxID=428993 RepID=A0A1T5JDZ7_9GAMM|nr:hypothetical protein [Pseudoxanthomonas indica]GGD58102.1 hypothetical protein GCM10007235_33010 [Pseudoxanthomonas indica]SKC49609.1 hypothetical protein SAMN06296058_0723 [Pseudoxanthomonas indica]
MTMDSFNGYRVLPAVARHGSGKYEATFRLEADDGTIRQVCLNMFSSSEDLARDMAAIRREDVVGVSRDGEVQWDHSFHSLLTSAVG